MGAAFFVLMSSIHRALPVLCRFRRQRPQRSAVGDQIAPRQLLQQSTIDKVPHCLLKVPVTDPQKLTCVDIPYQIPILPCRAQQKESQPVGQWISLRLCKGPRAQPLLLCEDFTQPPQKNRIAQQLFAAAVKIERKRCCACAETAV